MEVLRGAAGSSSNIVKFLHGQEGTRRLYKAYTANVFQPKFENKDVGELVDLGSCSKNPLPYLTLAVISTIYLSTHKAKQKGFIKYSWYLQ